MSGTVEVIRRSNAAFNAGNYDELIALFDPEIEFVDHLPLPDLAQAAHGADAVSAVLEAWTRGFVGFHADVEEYVDLGEFVVCVTRWRFVSRDQGIEMEWRGAEAYKLREGRIVWAQAGFPDRATAVNAVERARN